MGTTALTWLGIAVCLSQSAIFSGLNLAVFSVSRLRLEVEATSGNVAAKRVLAIWQNPNFVLTTILWGWEACYEVLRTGVKRALLFPSRPTRFGRPFNQRVFLYSTTA